MDNKKENRFYEIDIIKSVAVVLMVVFHYYYIYYLMGKPLVKIDNTLLSLSAKLSHTIFIFLFGLNLSLSYNRNLKKNRQNEYYETQIKRSLLYICIGSVISFVSYKLIPNKFIFFGIFQFLSMSTMVSQLFVFNEFSSVTGIVIFSLLTTLLNNKHFRNNIINNILGFNTNFSSIDYFPFIPYFIYVLLGITCGHILYKNGERTFNMDKLDKVVEKSKLLKFIIYIGRNSLIIYILHWILFYMVM